MALRKKCHCVIHITKICLIMLHLAIEATLKSETVTRQSDLYTNQVRFILWSIHLWSNKTKPGNTKSKNEKMFTCTKNAKKNFRKDKIHEILSVHGSSDEVAKLRKSQLRAELPGYMQVEAAWKLAFCPRPSRIWHWLITGWLFHCIFLAFYKKWLSPRQN